MQVEVFNFKYVLNLFTHIVEKNPSKFKLDNKELSTRKSFIDSTREEVKVRM